MALRANIFCEKALKPHLRGKSRKQVLIKQILDNILIPKNIWNTLFGSILFKKEFITLLLI